MSSWKIGYPSGLDGAVSYDAGKVLYDKISAEVIVFDSTKMCRAVGKVSSVSGTVLTVSNITNYPNIAETSFDNEPGKFELDEFNSGFVKFLSGACKKKVYDITATTEYGLTSPTNLQSEGVAGNDYFEVVTGGCSFTFPAGRNPIRRDFKRRLDAESMRLPYYDGGLIVPRGWSQDDIVMTAYMTNEREVDTLEHLLNHQLDYMGFDAFYSTNEMDNSDGIAPLILQTGSIDIRNQILVNVTDYKIMKDAKRSDIFWEIQMHFENFTQPLYRGV
jgi:hypothetical protein